MIKIWFFLKFQNVIHTHIYFDEYLVCYDIVITRYVWSSVTVVSCSSPKWWYREESFYALSRITLHTFHVHVSCISIHTVIMLTNVIRILTEKSESLDNSIILKVKLIYLLYKLALSFKWNLLKCISQKCY